MPADPNSPQGKTLWEMFKDRWSSNGAGISFYNPLKWSVGGSAPIGESRLEFKDHDFSIQEIREYTRRIGGKEFRFTDYVLRGINSKTFENKDAVIARLRVVPNDAGGRDALLLLLDDEFAFNEDFLGVVKDTTGVFEVHDDDTNETETFNRINDVLDPYEAAVLVVSDINEKGLALTAKALPIKLEYWDYWREVEVAPGSATKRQFIFVELNSDTGWIQIWKGEEFFL